MPTFDAGKIRATDVANFVTGELAGAAERAGVNSRGGPLAGLPASASAGTRGRTLSARRRRGTHREDGKVGGGGGGERRRARVAGDDRATLPRETTRRRRERRRVARATTTTARWNGCARQSRGRCRSRRRRTGGQDETHGSLRRRGDETHGRRRRSAKSGGCIQKNTRRRRRGRRRGRRVTREAFSRGVSRSLVVYLVVFRVFTRRRTASESKRTRGVRRNAKTFARVATSGASHVTTSLSSRGFDCAVRQDATRASVVLGGDEIVGARANHHRPADDVRLLSRFQRDVPVRERGVDDPESFATTLPKSPMCSRGGTPPRRSDTRWRRTF